MNKIVICVHGGVVAGVRTDIPSYCQVEVFDVDNKESEGMSREAIDAEWLEVEKKTKPIY